MTHVLYIHGFLSSEMSAKARDTVDFFSQYHPDVTVHTPRMTNTPGNLKAQLERLIESTPALLEGGLKLIGSSLGGYLCTWLAETYGGRAVLINPAVRPFELLQDYLGEHINPYTQESFTLVKDDIHALVELNTPVISAPKRYKVLLQTGDETLDYRQAEEKYQHTELTIEEGGDHSFIGYKHHLPGIAAFLFSQQTTQTLPLK